MPFRRRRQPRRRRLDVTLEVWCLPVRAQRGVVSIHFVQPETVRILAILDHVESQTARLVRSRVLGVVPGHVYERRQVFRRYVNRYLENNHKAIMCSSVPGTEDSNSRA